MNYNFMLFSADYSWYQWIYKDLKVIENVRLFYSLDEIITEKEKLTIEKQKGFKKAIFLLYWRKCWKRCFFYNKKPIIFIWHMNYFPWLQQGGYILLRLIFPKAKHVFYFTDVRQINNRVLKKAKKIMDMVVIFDPIAAIKYDLNFWPNLYPDIKNKNHKDSDTIYDLCFIGIDKERTLLLSQIAKECISRGLSFYFVIKKNNKCIETSPYIIYIEDEMPYTELLEIVKKSKCILELKTKWESCSLRVQESIAFSKKLLTNNINVFNMPGCNNNPNIIYFDTIDQIEWEKIKKKPIDTSEALQFYLAPNWLEYLDKYFE